MAGFIRRYGSFPGTEVVTQIEGVVLVDMPPPGSIQGVGSGVVCMVGEFANCTFATTVGTTGDITAKIRPVEVFSAQDMINKVGGFDETIGEFGGDLGNGFAALRNKKFSRLVVAPVNLASPQGWRCWRELPLCTSQTNTNPVVPVQGGTVAAGREFRSGVGRVRNAARVEFTAREPITTGVGGTIAIAAGAVVQNFTGLADWSLIDRGDGTLGARKGDILVLGNNNAGAVQPLPTTSLGGGTYRVATTPGAGTTISLERLDGASFIWVAAAGTVPWRLHHSTDADSAPERVIGSSVPGGYAGADAGGAVVPLRPITSATGTQVDGTYTARTLLAPAVVPAAVTGDSCGALSGLAGQTHPTVATNYATLIQGVNKASDATIDALYAAAIDACISEDDPVRDINIMVAARKSATIRAKLKSHVLAASEVGSGRIAVIAPNLDATTFSTIIGSTTPGVGAQRNERVFYSWPGVQHSVPEAVGFLLGTALGTFTADGLLDDSMDHWLASLLSNLAPERNPGQAASPVPSVFAPILGFQRGVSGLGINEYTALRRQGVAAIRMDRTAGPIIQSGVTTSLISGEKNINRRRMADFIEDSLAQRLVQFSKLPLTNQLKDGAVGETDAFLSSLLSTNNPAAQRITDYQIDDKGGNTPEMEAQGIFVIITRVRTTPTADFIVVQSEIGEGVVTTA
jgi:hypothetical protein